MRRFEFTDEEFQTINQERFHHPDPNVQRRMEILWLKAHGETHQRIAELSGVGRRTVQRVLDLFWDGRLDAVRQFHWYQPISVLAGRDPADPQQPLRLLDSTFYSNVGIRLSSCIVADARRQELTCLAGVRRR